MNDHLIGMLNKQQEACTKEQKRIEYIHMIELLSPYGEGSIS